MNDKDFEEMLKKSIESLESLADDKYIPDTHGDDLDGDDDIPEGASHVMNILKTAGLMDLAKAAQKRMDEEISALTYILCDAKGKDEIKYRSLACAKIKSAAKKLDVLHTIMSAAAISGGAAIGGMKDPPEKMLNMILKLGTM